MDKYDFDDQGPASRDRIYVSWSEQWDLPRYVEEYLQTRKLRTDAAARLHIEQCIRGHPWEGPLRKADVDYYLDTNANKQELALPESMGVSRTKPG